MFTKIFNKHSRVEEGNGRRAIFYTTKLLYRDLKTSNL